MNIGELHGKCEELRTALDTVLALFHERIVTLREQVNSFEPKNVLQENQKEWCLADLEELEWRCKE